MTNLEHLIENTLYNFESNKTTEEILKAIDNDINLKESGITAEQCWEICQYIWCCFIADRYEKVKGWLENGINNK